LELDKARGDQTSEDPRGHIVAGQDHLDLVSLKFQQTVHDFLP